MSRFNSFLRKTGQRLTLPSTTKSLILVEIASDLQDLFDHYVSQGMSEEDAMARAEEKVDISTEALTELVRIHSDARSWSDRVSSRVQPFWERIALALIVIFLIGISVTGIDSTLLSATSVFVWPVLVIFVALLTHAISLGVRSVCSQNHRRLRDSLATPLFLGAASLVVGVGGFAIDLYLAMHRMIDDADNWASHFARAFFGGSTTMMLAILVALCAALVWFVAAGRVARLEHFAFTTFTEVSK